MTAEQAKQVPQVTGLRLSVGLEDEADLIADLERGFGAVGK